MISVPIWENFLKIVKEEVGSRVVDTWFKSITFSYWDSNRKTIYLKAPNSFIENWITTHYKSLFDTHFPRLLNVESVKVVFLDNKNNKTTSKNLHDNPEVSLKHNDNNAGKGDDVTDKIDKESVTSNFNIIPARSLFPKRTDKGNRSNSNKLVPVYRSLNNHYLFDNFIVGSHNSLAYAAAYAITEKPGVLYNPLFIYGGTGLGKTHLLNAIANQVKKTYTQARVVYQSADKFVHEFINAIRFDKILNFEQKYKSADIFLLDDIQFLSKKEQTQEAFFHIFNTLYDARKQVVFSSDSLPKDIKGFANRLKSRLHGGLIADIQAPTLETKIAILKKKAELHKEQLDDQVAHYLACISGSNIRELEGLLIRLFAVSSLMQQQITLDFAKYVFNDSLSVIDQNKIKLDLSYIAQAVAQYYNFTVNELRSDKRYKKISSARHIAMYLMKKLTTSSLKEIAVYWKRKDHSTVIYALDKVESYRVKDQNLFKNIEKLKEHILN